MLFLSALCQDKPTHVWAAPMGLLMPNTLHDLWGALKQSVLAIQWQERRQLLTPCVKEEFFHDRAHSAPERGLCRDPRPPLTFMGAPNTMLMGTWWGPAHENLGLVMPVFLRPHLQPHAPGFRPPRGAHRRCRVEGTKHRRCRAQGTKYRRCRV